jgi:uncharacterized repeat protein (TIGR03837 family)
MLWDVFCRVIDNFGDIGVCWRLCTDLAARGHQARLWVDDASALAWMAPHGSAGVEVRAWREAEDASAMATLSVGDVVIESFGCHLPEAFVARMQRPTPPAWVNLEYLSAEDYVERSHELASPVFSGAGAGLRKRFFYPGFTRATGGLLREPDLMARQARFLANERLPWLHRLGVPATEADRLVSVFCYAGAPLGAWLDAWQAEAQAMEVMTRVLLTPGHATDLAVAWQAEGRHTFPSGLQLHPLPALPQTEFDLLLWACHLNIVRGEDSAVRALWAGRPHVWHIYPQDDGVHAGKLDAFMDRWMHEWPEGLATSVRGAWRHFNGVQPEVLGHDVPPVEPLPDWGDEDGVWATESLGARSRLLAQADLVTQLTDFVARSG